MQSTVSVITTSDEIHARISAACLSDAPEDALNQLLDECISRGDLGVFNQAIEGVSKSSSYNPLETISMTAVSRLMEEIPTENPDVERLWALIGEHGNAKEVIVAINEALEKIIQCTGDDDDDKQYSIHLRMLVDLLASALSRMTLRRRPASDILQTSFSDVLRAWSAIVPETSQSLIHSLFSSILHCVRTSWTWVVASTPPDSRESVKCREILCNLILPTLAMSSHFLKTSVATTTFETRFPELVIPGRKYLPSKSEEDARTLLCTALDVCDYIGFDCDLRLQKTRSRDAHEAIGCIILLAYDQNVATNAQTALSTALPATLFGFQLNLALDEVLAFLLECLYGVESTVRLPDDLVTLLTSSLTPVASLHPSPNVRKIAFTLMARILELSGPLTRKEILYGLVAECAFPQMRVAAVQLLKKCILDTLEGKSDLPLSTYTELSSVLLRPDPPTLFQDLEYVPSAAFLQSSEPARLTQSLGLYFVLLKRDRENQTGVRDKNHIKATENGLLNPLRHVIANGEPRAHGSPDAIQILFPLITALDRVDEALKDI
ncbi:hypothetical protein FRC03_000566 [Tulasnella sp. 419]|nr:hypothetical protein FRC03_000566 [Tulasnella sp. 419]